MSINYESDEDWEMLHCPFISVAQQSVWDSGLLKLSLFSMTMDFRCIIQNIMWLDNILSCYVMLLFLFVIYLFPFSTFKERVMCTIIFQLLLYISCTLSSIAILNFVSESRLRYCQVSSLYIWPFTFFPWG